MELKCINLLFALHKEVIVVCMHSHGEIALRKNILIFSKNRTTSRIWIKVDASYIHSKRRLLA